MNADAEPPPPPEIPIAAPDMPLRNALQGLAAFDQNLALLEYANVLIRRDYKETTLVKIASGGCPGLELNYTGLVGKGMLTVAILGDPTTAPCSRLILRVIRDLLAFNNDGVLLITQANPESFSFGLACQRALAECLRIKYIVIDDNRSCYRNSCGFVLICKIAGAMSEARCPFHEIHQVCSKAAMQLCSLTLHNYGAVQTMKPVETMNLLCDYDVEDIICMENLSLKLDPTSRIVGLINVPKTMNRTEQFTLVKRVLDRLSDLKIAIVRMYTGHFMVVPKEGVMLTVMRVDSCKILEYLDAPTTATGWNEAHQSILPALTCHNVIACRTAKLGRMESDLRGPALDDKSTKTLRTSVQFAVDALISCERQLNLVDAEKSRGNLGTRVCRACQHLNKRFRLNRISTQNPYNFLKVAAAVFEGGIGGTMGSIYGMAFETAADYFAWRDAMETVTALTWLEAYSAAVDGLANHLDRDNEFTTMMHPLLTCDNVTRNEMRKGTPLFAALGQGVYAAEQAAMQTRAVGAQHPDAGAHAVGIWLRAVFEGCKLSGGFDETGGDASVDRKWSSEYSAVD